MAKRIATYAEAIAIIAAEEERAAERSRAREAALPGNAGERRAVLDWICDTDMSDDEIFARLCEMSDRGYTIRIDDDGYYFVTADIQEMHVIISWAHQEIGQ